MRCPSNFPSGSWIGSSRPVENFAVIGSGVLAAAIGMVSQAGRRLLPLDGHGQGCDSQFRPHVVTHRPADDFAGEEIEHHGQIERTRGLESTS
jgi:hypothetical protein